MSARSNLATKDEPLVVERVFDAPVALVWKALTDIDDLRHWFLDIREFEPRVGFEFQFYAGKDQTKYLHGCKVTEVIPNKRLAYTWRYGGYEGDSLVTIDLFAEGKGVVVRGRMGAGGEFHAEEVIAKHDENYEPPEVTDALSKAKKRTAAAE